MEALGAAVVHQGTGPAATIEVTGVAGAFRQPSAPLDCGNSGSTMRMLAGLIAPHPHTFTLLGDHSLTLRPMERIRKPLNEMGAILDLVDGHAPITIHGGPLHAIDFTTPIPSASPSEPAHAIIPSTRSRPSARRLGAPARNCAFPAGRN